MPDYPLAERVAVLETNAKAQDKKLEEIDKKLDRLLALANMGKGAWWMILKIGGFLSVLIGLAAWAWQHIHPAS